MGRILKYKNGGKHPSLNDARNMLGKPKGFEGKEKGVDDIQGLGDLRGVGYMPEDYYGQDIRDQIEAMPERFLDAYMSSGRTKSDINTMCSPVTGQCSRIASDASKEMFENIGEGQLNRTDAWHMSGNAKGKGDRSVVDVRGKLGEWDDGVDKVLGAKNFMNKREVAKKYPVASQVSMGFGGHGGDDTAHAGLISGYEQRRDPESGEMMSVPLVYHGYASGSGATGSTAYERPLDALDFYDIEPGAGGYVPKNIIAPVTSDGKPAQIKQKYKEELPFSPVKIFENPKSAENYISRFTRGVNNNWGEVESVYKKGGKACSCKKNKGRKKILY